MNERDLFSECGLCSVTLATAIVNAVSISRCFWWKCSISVRHGSNEEMVAFSQFLISVNTRRFRCTSDDVLPLLHGMTSITLNRTQKNNVAPDCGKVTVLPTCTSSHALLRERRMIECVRAFVHAICCWTCLFSVALRRHGNCIQHAGTCTHDEADGPPVAHQRLRKYDANRHWRLMFFCEV